MATEVSAPPNMAQLQSVQKVMALPTVGAAVGQVGAFYTKVKGAHSLLEWAMSTAEASVTLAATTAVPYVAAPLAAGDARVAAAIDELERRVPLVTEQPKVIVETTKQAVLSRISPHVNKVCVARAAAGQRVHSLKELSWAKANALLSTAYGQKAMHGIDTGATYAMQLLDQYLPPVGPQSEPTDSAKNISLGSLAERSHAKANALLSTEYGQRALHGLDIGAIYVMQLLNQYLPPVEPQPEPTGEIVTATTDPALHTAQTVGRLSAVAARRVWANLAYKVNELRANGIELDVRRYVTALMAALHLAKVTSEQQRAECAHAQEHEHEHARAQPPPAHAQEHEHARAQPPPAEPAPPAPQPRPASVAAPTTANKVKTTPEAKSDISEPNEQ